MFDFPNHNYDLEVDVKTWKLETYKLQEHLLYFFGLFCYKNGPSFVAVFVSRILYLYGTWRHGDLV